MNGVQVYGSLVAQMVKYVVSHLSILAPLLVPEYQIDPSMQVARDIVGLHGPTELVDKVVR